VVFGVIAKVFGERADTFRQHCHLDFRGAGVRFVAPMLRDTPRLKDKVADARSRDSGNTILHKTFAGGHLTIVGSNSAAGLASRPIRVLLRDEIDRYAASAGAEGDLGEEAVRSVRIIPLTVHAALGHGHPIQIFGTSYPTSDGTAVRDYVHVSDIARANLLALQFVEQGHPGAVVNIGTGTGVSVRQIIDAVCDETGQSVPFHEHLPRGGDAARVIADTARARELLGWTPAQPDLAQIVASAVGSYRAQAAVEAGRLRETVC